MCRSWINIIATDDVSVWLDNWDNTPVVIIGDESERMLHNRNINAFITLTEKRRRSITFSVTIQSNGNVTAYIIKYVMAILMPIQ